MRKNREAIGSVAFMCAFAIWSLAASCQEVPSGTSNTTFQKITVLAQTGGRIEKYIKINDSAKMTVVYLKPVLKRIE